MSRDEGVYLGRQDPQVPNDSGFLARLLAAATVPMPTFGYHALPPRDGRPAPKVIGDDPQLLAMTAHVRKPKERMMEFYSRVGLGPTSIRTMSKDEITRFVETVSKNEEGFNRAADFEPKGIPARLNI